MRELSTEAYVRGVRSNDRAILGRAVTLVESRRPDHRERAREVLTALAPYTGNAHRVGISGVPGVGKSTFIETFGMKLIDEGHRVAVLAVDPSSSVTGGSILGDKTRMQKLANEARAFVRPSPTAGTLGGVARRTYETMLLCEAAGFDVVIVESVGVGQSEAVLAEMVDFFLLLMLPGAGDELQGIKRGILELADLVAVNKSDGDRLPAARLAQAELLAALRILKKDAPEVVLTSGRTGDGLEAVWAAVQKASDGREPRRARQLVDWTRRLVKERLEEAFFAHGAVKNLGPRLEREVAEGKITPSAAADALLSAFLDAK